MTPISSPSLGTQFISWTNSHLQPWSKPQCASFRPANGGYGGMYPRPCWPFCGGSQDSRERSNWHLCLQRFTKSSLVQSQWQQGPPSLWPEMGKSFLTDTLNLVGTVRGSTTLLKYITAHVAGLLQPSRTGGAGIRQQHCISPAARKLVACDCRHWPVCWVPRCGCSFTLIPLMLDQAMAIHQSFWLLLDRSVANGFLPERLFTLDAFFLIM